MRAKQKTTKRKKAVAKSSLKTSRKLSDSQILNLSIKSFYRELGVLGFWGFGVLGQRT